MAISAYTPKWLITAMGDTSAAQDIINNINFAVQGSQYVVTNITTAGNGTLTAAGLVNGIIVRSGPTGAFTDTTDTAANIIAALGATAPVNDSWEIIIKNTTAFAQTVAAGSGVTLSGSTVVPALSAGRFLLTYSAAGAITMVGLTTVPFNVLPAAQYVQNTTAGATTAAVGDITGANFCNLELTAVGTANYTTRTAVQMIADLANAQVGQTWMVQIKNSSAGTTTIVGGTGVTVTGTATIATTASRLFMVTINTSSTMTLQNVT